MSYLRRIAVGGLLVAGGVLFLNVPGQAAAQRTSRSGPHDWSHGHMVASAWDQNDPVVRRDWRTLRKQMQLDDARAARQSARSLLQEFFNILKSKVQPAAPTTNDGSTLDWAIRTGGTGSVVGYPAKYSFDISASNCSDVIYFTVNQSGDTKVTDGDGLSPNVIAVTNPYGGCPGNATGKTPTIKFALAMTNGTGTSPTLSLDGSILYFFESPASGAPTLHAVKVASITSTPGAYNFTTNSWTQVHTLTAAEQLFSKTFTGYVNNSSSPFYDYAGNQIFFGDSTGKVHRVINANLASASEPTGWPASCGSSVFQSLMYYNNNVIGSNNDGFLYRVPVGSGTPSCIATAQAAAGTGTLGVQGQLTSPLLDITNGTAIVAAGYAAAGAYKGVGMFRLNFTAGENYLGGTYLGASDGVYAQFPALDDAFWSSNNGNLYEVGTNDTGNTLLIKIPYNGVSFGTVTKSVPLHGTITDSVNTSPITEFLTASTTNPDYIFVGGNAASFYFMNRVSATSAAWTSTTANVMDGFYALTSGGVSSGISIDTRTALMTTDMATANIYFGTSSLGTTQSQIIQLAQKF